MFLYAALYALLNMKLAFCVRTVNNVCCDENAERTKISNWDI